MNKLIIKKSIKKNKTNTTPRLTTRYFICENVNINEAKVNIFFE